MTEPTETEKTIEPEEVEADAFLGLHHDGNSLSVQLNAREGLTLSHPAVHFANWLGQNSQRLWAESRDDYNESLRKTARKVLEPKGPRLVSHTGELLN